MHRRAALKHRRAAAAAAAVDDLAKLAWAPGKQQFLWVKALENDGKMDMVKMDMGKWMNMVMENERK